MIPHSCQYRNKMLNWGLSIWFLKLNKLYSSDQERKKNLEKKHVYFFIKASQLVIDSSHLNEHPSSTTTQKIEIKPPCMLSRFSEVIIKRKTFIKKVLTPPKNKQKKKQSAQPEYQRIFSVKTQDFLTGCDDFFLFGSWSIWMKVFVSHARLLGKILPSPPQISQYVKSAVGRLHNYIHACVLGLNNINISDCCRRPRM